QTVARTCVETSPLPISITHTCFKERKLTMSNSGPGGGDIFDVRKVRRLVELMKEHDLAEIDLRQGEQRVRLRRGAEPLVAVPSAYSIAAQPTASGSPATAEK